MAACDTSSLPRMQLRRDRTQRLINEVMSVMRSVTFLGAVEVFGGAVVLTPAGGDWPRETARPAS